MKVVGFVGSPREGGNTEILVGEMLKGASEEGAETEIFNLNKMDIKPCQACQHCKGNNGECATDDDMQTIYKKIKEADAFVLGAPIYMWQMSAQAKLFTDRLYAFFMTGFEEKYGKKDVALVFSQGNPDEKMFEGYINSTRDMFNFLGYNVKEVLSSNGNQAPGEVKNKEDVLKKARESGKNLVS
ncbi:MAG: flavodoxin family protein [Methanobacterium paludis]|nr:flavodoxin family protein [Methanobacterium paludis]